MTAAQPNGRSERPASAAAVLSAAAPPVLEVRDLKTQFFTDEGIVHAVDGVSFSVAAGETLGIVGESGSGKSVTALSLMRLLEEPSRIIGGEIRFQGRDVMAMTPGELRALRGGGHRHGLPGPDDLAQPGAAHRAPARRDHGRARALHGGRGGASARSSCSDAWASRPPSARSTAIRTNSRAACASAWRWPWA